MMAETMKRLTENRYVRIVCPPDEGGCGRGQKRDCEGKDGRGRTHLVQRCAAAGLNESLLDTQYVKGMKEVQGRDRATQKVAAGEHDVQ